MSEFVLKTQRTNHSELVLLICSVSWFVENKEQVVFVNDKNMLCVLCNRYASAVAHFLVVTLWL